MPTTPHHNNVNARVKGWTIDVGKVIEQEIIDCATKKKKKKSAAFLFPSLIIGIYKAFGVKICGQ